MMMLTAITAVALPHLRITTLSVVRSMAMAYALAAIVIAQSSLHNGALALFNGSVLVDTMGTYLTATLLALAVGILALYSSSVLEGTAAPYTLVVLLLILFVGAFYLATGGDLVTIAVALETQSFALYALAALYRWDEGSTSAGLMYFMLGAFSSGLVLLGLSMVYAYVGSTSLMDLMAHTALAGSGGYLKASLVVMTTGLLFKVAAAPVHYWAPEVYDRVPTVMTVVLNVLPKLALLGVLARLSPLLGAASLAPLMNLVAVLSWGFGSVVGLVQARFKRLLAYSTISHVGWMLAAITVGSSLGVGAFLFYLLQYSATSVLTFLALIALSVTGVVRVGGGPTSSLKDVEWISSLNGLYARSVLLTVMLAATLFSAAGIPPLVGFYAKLAALQALLYGSSPLLVVLGVGASVVSAGYYLSVVAALTFNRPA